MTALSRIVGVYRLLERARLADAMAASAEVVQAETEMELLAADQQVNRQSHRANVEDAVTRSVTQICLASSSVTIERIQAIREVRVKEHQQAMLDLADSRVRLKQVEQTLTLAKEEKQAQQSRRSQAAADERFLSQRFQSGDSMKRF